MNGFNVGCTMGLMNFDSREFYPTDKKAAREAVK